MKYRLVSFCYLALHFELLKITYLVWYLAFASNVVLLVLPQVFYLTFLCVAFYTDLLVLMANKSNC